MEAEDESECPTDLTGFIALYWNDRKHIILPMRQDWLRWKYLITLAQGGVLVIGIVSAVLATQGIHVRSDIIQQGPVAPVAPIAPRR